MLKASNKLRPDAFPLHLLTPILTLQ